MKKIISLFVAIGIIFCLTSCFEDGIDSFSITSYPKQTYVKGESFDWTNVEVSINGTTYNYADAKDQGVVFQDVNELSTTTAGTYTAIVTYSDNTVSFQYTVLDSYFANGNGTKENPYQVSTFAQLDATFDKWERETYFVLINDIVLGSKSKNGQYFGDIRNAHIDGQGYAIRDIQSVLTYYIDGVVTFENIDFYVNSKAAFDEQNIICYQCGFYVENSVVTFKNANFFGSYNSSAMNNYSLFGYVTNNSKLILEDSNNHVDFNTVSAAYGAVFTNGVKTGSSLYLINSSNYGNAFGQAVGLFVGNGTSYYGGNVIIDENSHNYGKVISTLYKSNLLVCNQGGKYTADLDTYVKSYRYNDQFGIVDNAEVASKFASLSDEEFKGYAVVDSSYTDAFEVLSLSVVDGYLSLSCSKEDEVAYYLVSFSGQSLWYKADGTRDGGLGIQLFEFGKDKKLTSVEMVNALKLEPLSVINTKHADCANAENCIDAEAVTTVDANNGLKVYSDGAARYYVFTSYATNGSNVRYSFAAKNYAFVVTAMSSNGYPLGSVSYSVK